MKIIQHLRKPKKLGKNAPNLKQITVKPAHNGQIRSQTKSTIRSKWPLRATAIRVYGIFFPDRIKKKNKKKHVERGRK